MDDTDFIISVLHLRSASKLLEKSEPAISMALLQLSKAIMQQHNILDESIKSAMATANTISCEI